MAKRTTTLIKPAVEAVNVEKVNVEAVNIDDLTIAQLRALAKLQLEKHESVAGATVPGLQAGEQAVIACTDKKGVFFGYTKDIAPTTVTLRAARMVLYWSHAMSGVQGLASIGPIDANTSIGCRISAESDAMLHGVTAIFPVTPSALNVWVKAPVYRSK